MYGGNRLRTKHQHQPISMKAKHTFRLKTPGRTWPISPPDPPRLSPELLEQKPRPSAVLPAMGPTLLVRKVDTTTGGDVTRCLDFGLGVELHVTSNNSNPSTHVNPIKRVVFHAKTELGTPQVIVALVIPIPRWLRLVCGALHSLCITVRSTSVVTSRYDTVPEIMTNSPNISDLGDSVRTQTLWCMISV